MDSSSDHESIYREIEQNKICLFNSLLYETYALFLEAKGRLIDAFLIYHLGISRLLSFSEDICSFVGFIILYAPQHMSAFVVYDIKFMNLGLWFQEC